MKRHGCGPLRSQFLNVGIRSGQLNYRMGSDYVKVWEGNAPKLGGCLSHGACFVRRQQERKLAERKHGSHLSGLKLFFVRRLCRVD